MANDLLLKNIPKEDKEEFKAKTQKKNTNMRAVLLAAIKNYIRRK